ncbi:hypothetical protein L7F22_029618 [Adiantum nelumboides]|nr:hypothetical protein [Adiantum nelumboides]
MAFLVSGRDDEAVKLRAFPLVLKEEARTWFQTLNPAQRAGWEVLKTAFLQRFQRADSAEEIWEKNRKILYQYQVGRPTLGFNVNPSIDVTQAPPSMPNVPEFTRGQQDMLQQINNLTNQLENLSVNLVQAARRPAEGNGGNRPPPRRQARELICYNCGENGHGMYNCPHPRRYDNPVRGPRQEVTPPRARPQAPEQPPPHILQPPRAQAQPPVVVQPNDFQNEDSRKEDDDTQLMALLDDVFEEFHARHDENGAIEELLVPLTAASSSSTPTKAKRQARSKDEKKKKPQDQEDFDSSKVPSELKPDIDVEPLPTSTVVPSDDDEEMQAKDQPPPFADFEMPPVVPPTVAKVLHARESTQIPKATKLVDYNESDTLAPTTPGIIPLNFDILSPPRYAGSSFQQEWDSDMAR